jgi:hypothetical protein
VIVKISCELVITSDAEIAKGLLPEIADDRKKSLHLSGTAGNRKMSF